MLKPEVSTCKIIEIIRMGSKLKVIFQDTRAPFTKHVMCMGPITELTMSLAGV